MKMLDTLSLCAVGAAIAGCCLGGCGSGGGTTSPSPTGSGVADLVQSVATSDGKITGRFVTGASLPAPASTGVDPRVIGTSHPVQAGGTAAISVFAPESVDDILIGVPGGSGYYDLPINGTNVSETPAVVSLNLALGGAAPSSFTLIFETVTGGAASPATTLSVTTTNQNVDNSPGCGGGQVSATFSNASGVNTSTLPVTLGFVRASQSFSAGQSVSVIAGGCRNAADQARGISIYFAFSPSAGTTYTIGQGMSVGVFYTTTDGTWSPGSGTVTVQTFGDTMSFTAHLAMQPSPFTLDGTPNSAVGTFTLDLTGVAAVVYPSGPIG